MRSRVVRIHLLLLFGLLFVQGVIAQEDPAKTILSGDKEKTSPANTGTKKKSSSPSKEKTKAQKGAGKNDQANTAQEPADSEPAETPFEPYHRIGVSMAHAHISEAIQPDGSKGWKVAGAWGIGYRYIFRKRMGLGLRADLIVEKFSVQKQKGDQRVIFRNNPLSVNATFSYRVVGDLTLLAGSGSEYSAEDILPTSTIGAEYGWSIPKGFVVGAALTYSVKWNVYDSWFFGFVIAKKFGRNSDLEQPQQ